MSRSLGLRLGLGISAATSVASGPPFSAIAADGWQATVASPSDLSLAPVTVNDEGFDETGIATTVSRTLYLTKLVRDAFPNQTNFVANKQALNDYVLSTTTIDGATNSSTLVSPKPIAAVVSPSRLVVGNTIHEEVAAFHYFADNGKQVPCVQFRATDGTNTTAWQTVSTPTPSTLCEDLNPIEVFACDIDITSLNPGLVWTQRRVPPWIGGTASRLDSEDNWTAGLKHRYFSRRFYRKDVSRAAGYYYVYLASTGNDSTGVVSMTAATAKATPCLTLAGAWTRIRTLLGNTQGAFDGIKVRVTDTVNSGTFGYDYYQQDIGAVMVERDPDVSRATAKLINNGQIGYQAGLVTHTSGMDENAIIFKDMTVEIGSGGSFVGSAGNKLDVQFWNCNVIDNSPSGGQRANSSLSYFGTVFSTYTSALGRTSNGEIRIMRGVSVDLANTAHEGWVTVGCNLTRVTSPALADAKKDGHIWYGIKYLNPYGSGNSPIRFTGAAGDSGLDLGSAAIVQCVVEMLVGGTPGIFLAADTSHGNLTHVVMHHNALPGSEGNNRINGPYDDHATVARNHKFVSDKGNIYPNANIKGDVNVSNGARLGHFAPHHGVGRAGNFMRHYDEAAANKVTGPASLSFGHLYSGMGSINGGGDPMFTDNKAVSGTSASPVTGTGGGTYTLQSGSPAKNLLSAPLLAYDLAGNSRGTGTQHAGAYI